MKGNLFIKSVGMICGISSICGGWNGCGAGDCGCGGWNGCGAGGWFGRNLFLFKLKIGDFRIGFSI
jgi:hypothetical protein